MHTWSDEYITLTEADEAVGKTVAHCPSEAESLSEHEIGEAVARNPELGAQPIRQEVQLKDSESMDFPKDGHPHVVDRVRKVETSDGIEMVLPVWSYVRWDGSCWNVLFIPQRKHLTIEESSEKNREYCNDCHHEHPKGDSCLD